MNIDLPVSVNFYSLIWFSWASKIERKADKNTKPRKKNKERNDTNKEEEKATVRRGLALYLHRFPNIYNILRRDFR